jgi:hypothetical protein
MELAIPILALTGLYFASNQSRDDRDEDNELEEGFAGYQNLPNTNLPNVNYPTEYPIKSEDYDVSAKLAVDNRYQGENYLDKFYSANHPKNLLTNTGWESASGMKCPPRELSSGSESFIALTGEQVGCDYYRHNNMVPYFGSKTRSRQFEANQNEGLLDTYLGTGTQSIVKKEQAPLFSPNDNYQWAYGVPNQNDFMQSRVNPSLKMANVLPFQQEKLGPGIGLGYGTEGEAGYNSGMMAREKWLPKTVDELRVNNHRKASGVSTLGYEGPAATQVKEMGSIGTVEKNRPERHFEMGQNRLMTTTGIEKGPTLRPIQEDRYTNRPETTVDYAGIAASQNMGAHVEGEYMPSKNHHLGAVPMSVASSAGKGGATEADYGAKSQLMYANNRSSNVQTDYFGSVGGAIGAVISPLLDALRPSRKANVVGTLRPYQNASTTVPQSYIFNPADRTPTTIRETTENSKFHLNSGTNQLNKGGYTVSGNQPIANHRMSQSDYFYSGNSSASGSSKQIRPYDAEYRQHNNEIKSSTIDGRLVPGNMSLMNNSMNIKEGDRNGSLSNNRAPVPAIYNQSPGVETMGRLQGKQQLNSNIQIDRTTPDLLNQLKANPYALSITNK